MTYDQLVAFTTVAAEGTFTGASEALHKSQPAVSKLIRNLEGELGVVLFDRTRYRATLTDAGRVFYERAAAVIESTHALRGFGLALGGKVEPIVRLAVEAVTPLDPIVKILRDVEARFPSVRFELHTERLAGAAEALRDGRADVVVATMLGIDAAKVDATPFARIRIVSIREKSMRYVCALTIGSEQIATGTITVVCVSKDQHGVMKARPFPPDIASRFEVSAEAEAET